MSTDNDEWSQAQMKPLGMFELATRWSDAIKVIGTGNGAGVVAAGAALNSFHQRPDVIFWVKFGGVSFFVGVFAFALGFACIQLATFSYDEMLHATRRAEINAIHSNSNASTSAMNAANWLAVLSAAAFFVGLSIGMVAFLKF